MQGPPLLLPLPAAPKIVAAEPPLALPSTTGVLEKSVQLPLQVLGGGVVPPAPVPVPVVFPLPPCPVEPPVPVAVTFDLTPAQPSARHNEPNRANGRAHIIRLALTSMAISDF